MKILIPFFSATENTARIAEVIRKRLESLGAGVEELDITPRGSRASGLDLGPYDAVIFGAPIHSNRAPRVVREWLMILDGGGKKCSTFFTYGGFTVHPTHYSTQQILKKKNFVQVSSAEFLGKHTFNLGGWKALPDRPDKSDFAVAEKFAEETYKRFTGEDNDVLGEMEKTNHTEEYLDEIEGVRFRAVTQLPTRGGEECSMCMKCEELCPTNAMIAEIGEAEAGKCIACLRCVDVCPDGALKINDLSHIWPIKLQMENETEETIRNKESKIYL
ncbi:MAG: EFR1 family ferrodoxin [Deltaproteobacteria bacterium]|uniref:EFR1 family ferrodoxin n=1 Tax=Candidatus Zymogenus saltonus TaxID=2844893 RepID=A0A9D8KGF7_9DELT|nr:EFR1 family ferrodoxin [Candidatus Zymogenus saltonus]